MNTLNKQLLMRKLNELMELEYEETCEYSTTAECFEAKKGFEIQYERQKKKVRLIQSAKCDILFSFYNEDKDEE